MNRPPVLKRRWLTAATLAAVAGALALLFTASVPAQDGAASTDKKASQPDAKPAPKAKKKAAKKTLSGSELYAINCGRCHPERYPTEFTSNQWQTLLTHMRVRANLPAKQARVILKYLQEESGN